MEYREISNQGERVVPGDHPRIWKEHTDRYRFALSYARPEHRVVDCACGSGYGTDILASQSREVTGIDISPVAIAYCRKHYPSVSFLQGTIEMTGLATGSIDVFCSFETLEHIQAPERALEEMRRVVTDEGILLLSVPNRINSGLAAGERPKNPFHMAEWSLTELDALLRPFFTRRQYFGQRIRSRNKFSALYIESKMKRWFGRVDITRLPREPAGCQPDNFVAACRK